MVADISKLKKTRLSLETLSNQPSTLEADKQRLDELRVLILLT